jgi:hypothetical protein
MLWECISSSRCECGGLDRENINTLRPNIFGGDAARNIEEQWFEVVQQYSGLNASHPSDKLPALSGIAEQFHEKLKCDYLAGLWHNHLLRGLTWIVADGNKACRQSQYRAPTWSWASLDKLSSPRPGHQGVRVTYTLTKSIRQDNRLAIETARVQTDGKNRYGVICEGGFIILKAAFLTPCTVETETEVLMTGEIESILLLQFKGHEKKVLVQPDIAFTLLPLGIRRAPYDAKELRWLFLGDIEKQHYGLLLVPSKGQKGVYERVGLGRIYLLSASLKDKSEVGTFTVV